MKLQEILTKNEFLSLNVTKFTNEIILFHEGQLCDCVCYVVEGEVDIVSYTATGEENIISIINKDGFFANALIFSESPYYLGEVLVKKNTTLVLIKKDQLISLLQKNLNFLTYYLKQMSNKTIYMSKRNKLLANKSIRSRLLYYFETNKGKVKASITSISKELILPRPSVSREISKMIEEGLIIKEGKTIYLVK